MSKLFLLIFLLLFSCSKSYIDVEETPPATPAPMQVTSTYSSVDFAQFNFFYSLPSEVYQLEIRREDVEIPLSEYDGDLVFLDDSHQTTFLDYQSTNDLPTLESDKTYYYSIFYRSNDLTLPPQRLVNLTIDTLSYKEGMLQTLSELIQYSKTLNNNWSHMVSTELLSLFYDESQDPPVLKQSTAFDSIDGVIVQSLNYSKYNLNNNLPVSSNQVLQSYVRHLKRLFAVDYCSKSNLNCINDVRQTYIDNDLIGFIYPQFVDDISTDLPDIVNESSITSISSLADPTLKNFVFLESVFPNMISQLVTSNYDLIVMSPFSSDNNWTNLFSLADVTSLKTKANGISSRLVFAYIDISTIWDVNSYYWNTDWNQLLTRPNWIDLNRSPNSDDFYVKYWRTEWKDIIKSILPAIASKGYDGIVFGGGEVFSDYPLTN